jgi:translocation and assembly module TamB
MRALFKSLKWLGMVFPPLTALLAALWWFTGTGGSLSVALNALGGLLPAGQYLQVKEVTGNLRDGGHVAWLKWTQGELSVEVQNLNFAWNLGGLLNKQLQFQRLSAVAIHIDDRRAPSPAAPPPEDWSLPLTLDVPFSVDHLTLSGGSSLNLTEFRGRYSFDSYSHILHEGYAHISLGTYQLDAELQARAPMALKLQLTGQVQTTVPGSTEPLTVAATASLKGHLAGSSAALNLQAHLKPEPGVSAMQADLSANISPWQAQPLTTVLAQWQRLDLHTMWPQAPQTELSGQAEVIPKADSWQAQVQLRNTLPGPWNDNRLPVNALSAALGFNAGQWTVDNLKLQGAGGRLTGSGQIKAGQWSGHAKIEHLQPGAIHTQLDNAALSGELQAEQTDQGIRFTAEMAAAAQAASTKTLQIQQLQLKGLWSAPQLTVSDLQLRAADAQLGGAFSYNTQTHSSQAKLNLSLPGLQAALDGHLAAQDGLGQLSVQVQNAAAANQWLSRWPVLAKALPSQPAKGTAQLQANWQGGWQASSKQPNGLNLTSTGQAHLNARTLQWQASASAGQVNTGHWQGRLNQLQLSTQDDANPGLWTFGLGGVTAEPNADRAGIALDWQDLGKAPSLSVAAGSAQLTGSLPGKALLNWQALTWTPAQWHSQGQFSQLPLAWVDNLSGKTMADLGLSSDVLLNGQWDAQHADTLRLSVTVERSAGDLGLRTEGSGQQALPALLNEALLNLNLAGDQLSGNLRWDSERAGKALLAFSTQLQPTPQGWRWPQDAPLGGSVQVQLPPVDAWSVLAPPGWRMRGTLRANAGLTGTRQQPQWQGTLQADNLALRSAADGIDFQQGILRARLDGQQLHIEDFTLHGAGGQAGGMIQITGLAQWLDAGKPDTPLTEHVQIDLQATAKGLRVSTRSDRQITLSGQLHAKLASNLLTLGGQLGVDKALITLPSETAPVLGDDVVVRPSARAGAELANAPVKELAQSNAKGQTIAIQVQVSLGLGSDFQVRGRGLDSRLAGKLELQASDVANPSLRGTVRTVKGTFAAYGQKLDVEQGVLRFVGPADNPALDILAIRPKLSQRVGVQVLGTAQSPVVRLYAEPELSEAEKLSWLVLGRAAGGDGGEAALLQQAALALLSGSGQGPSASLTQALGLDELSFRSGNGDTTSGTSVMLGKRLSNDFYVAYESGLAGTVGVFTIFYDLSKRLTLRAQTGQQSAVDLIWTHRYD